MKTRYILEYYDNIIREIRRPYLFTEISLVESIQALAAESYFIYPITYSPKRKLKYKLGSPIHNLHPAAHQLMLSENITTPLFIADIARTLKVLPNQLKYFRNFKNGLESEFVTLAVPLNSLSYGNLLFIYCYQYLLQQNAAMLKQFREYVYSLKSTRKIGHFINTQHKAIVNLDAHLLKLIDVNSGSDLQSYNNEYTQTDCLKITYHCLEQLVRSIENEFMSYLDKDQNVPCLSGFLTYNDVAGNEYNNVDNLTLIDEQLRNIALLPITKLEHLKPTDLITYNQFFYCEVYRAALQNLASKSTSLITDDRLIDHLLEYNLNALSLFDYLTDHINAKLLLVDEPIEKLKILYIELKKYNQHLTLGSVRYNDQLPNVKQQITGWIEEEIDFQLRTMKLELPFSAQNINAIKGKLESGISVAQLSYTFNLLSQVGVISQKNQRDIFRFIADNFKTKLTDQISVDSIKSKYYNVETSTKAAVRDKMIEILNLTKL